MKFSVELEQDGDSELFEDLTRYLKYHPRLTRFLLNPAGFTFLVGWLLFIGAMMGLIAIAAVSASLAAKILQVMITELLAGREVAIPVGLRMGVPPLIVWGISAVQDLITTSWVYPVFYLYRRHSLGRATFGGYFFAKMEKSAERNRAFVERWGAIGLFVFMLIPFAVNGPLIGAILGKLAGVRTRYILPTVVLATFTATSIWTILYVIAAPTMDAFSAKYGGEWIQIIIFGILAFVVLRVALSFWRDVRHYRGLQERRAALARRSAVTQTLHAPPDEGREGAPPNR